MRNDETVRAKEGPTDTDAVIGSDCLPQGGWVCTCVLQPSFPVHCLRDGVPGRTMPTLGVGGQRRGVLPTWLRGTLRGSTPALAWLPFTGPSLLAPLVGAVSGTMSLGHVDARGYLDPPRGNTRGTRGAAQATRGTTWGMCHVAGVIE